MALLGVILLILIFVLIFRDVILKLVNSKKVNFLESEKVITKEYKIDNIKNKKINIDVLDTDIKILFDKNIDNIIIKTSYLIEKFSYDVDYDEENIKIIKNNKDNHKKLGNSGKILMKFPKKSMIDYLNISANNGDIEFYDIDVNNLFINSNNGIVKIDSLNGEDIEIFKLNGEVYLSHLNLVNLKSYIKSGNGDFIEVYGENIEVDTIDGDFIFVNACDENYKIKFLRANVTNGKQKLNVNADVIN